MAAALVAAVTFTVGATAAFGDEGDAGPVEVPAAVAEEVSATGAVDVIVQLADPGGGLAPAALVTDAATTEAAGHRLVAEVSEVGDEPPAEAEVLGNVGVVTMRVDAEQLDELSKSPLVSRIEPDITFAPALDTVATTVNARAAWGAGLTGRNRTVVIVDSGVNSSHPALAGKVVYEACFTNASCPDGSSVQRGAGSGQPCSFGSQCDHGTHVAGIVAGVDANYSGIAPGAGLISLQVFSRSTNPAECGLAPVPCPRARASDVLAALDEAYTLRSSYPGIVAVNMSLSSDSAQADCSTSSLRSAVDKLRAAGIATIVASGNGGSQNGLGVPACIPSTVSVGATNPDGASIWQLSNVSDQLDLVAPGVGVVSPNPTGGFSGTTGTSAAAPVVAGAWALASEALGTTDVNAIEAALKQSAVPLPYGAEGRTVGRLDLATLGGVGTPFGPQDLFTTMAGTTDQAGAGYTPVAGDFNGDGRGDILWYHQTGTDWLWTAIGGGRFTWVPTYEIPPGFRIASGDYNGDGRDDLFLLGVGSIAEHVWFSSGSTDAYNQFWGYPAARLDGDFEPLAGDFNGDGRSDVFLASATGGTSYVWYGVGTMAPGEQFAGSVAATTPNAHRPVTGDFDADGRDDILWYGPGDGRDWLWHGNAAVTAGEQFQVEELFGLTGDYRVASGDFDGNGRADLLFHLPGPTEDQIWYRQADGSFRGVVLRIDPDVRPVIGNFDGDAGRKDDIFWASDAQLPPDVMWLSR